MKNIIILLLLQWATFALSAQELWNDTLRLGYPYEELFSIAVQNDTVALYGVVIDTNTTPSQGLLLVQLDTNGQVLRRSFVTDPSGDDLAAGNWWANMNTTSDGGYIATAAPANRNSSMLVKWNKDLQLDFLQEYPDTINANNFSLKVANAPEGYFMYGTLQLADLRFAGVVKRVNNEGQLLWNKEFLYTNHGTFVVDIKQVTDSIFAFITLERMKPFSYIETNSYRSGIQYIDLSGNVLSSWKSAAEPEIGYLRRIVSADTSGLLLYGVQPTSPYLEQWWVRPTLSRWSPTQQVESVHHFGVEEVWSSEVTLREFIPTQDGHYLGVGRTALPSNMPTFKISHGWAYKCNAQGDSIWGASYPALNQNNLDHASYLYGCGQLTSGNIIGMGWARVFDDYYRWLIKFTNDGCMDTLLCLPTGLGEPHRGITGLRVWPNPAQGQLWAEWPDLTAAKEMVLYDLHGRAWLRRRSDGSPVSDLDISSLPAGLYLLALHGPDGRVLHRERVVIYD